MIQWMNCNQGFVMGVLTLVYVVATIFIWCSNKKAADASSEQSKDAAKQLEEMKNTQQQNVRIQLFEKRYDIHKSLSFWLSVAEEVFANSNTDTNLNYTVRAGLFDSKVFGTYRRIDRTQCINEINEIKGCIENYMAQEREKDLNEEELQKLEKLRDHLNFLDKQIISHKKSMDLAFEESSDINLSEFFYLDIDFEKLKGFANAFYSVVKNSSPTNFQVLEDAYKTINRAETLQKMREQLYVLEVNK